MRETEVGLDGVQVVLGNNERVNARKIAKVGKPWYICDQMSFTLPILLGPVFFRTPLPCSGGYHLERSEIRVG